MSNHFHIIVSAPDAATLSAFMGHINGNIAREVCILTGWNARLWGRRFRPVIIRDRKALVRSVKYIISHGCKEGLVLEPQEWPGVGCERALLFGEKLEGIWYDRTAFHEAEKRGKDVRLEDFTINYEVPLTPLPFLENASEGEVREFYQQLEAEIIAETRERLIVEGKQPIGAEAIKSLDPFSRPRNPKKSPAPMCHASSLRTRRKYLRSYKWFVAMYHKAVEKLRRGESNVEFPENCFLPPIACHRTPALGYAPG